MDSHLRWRDHVRSLRNVRPLLSLLWDAGPSLLIGTIVLRLTRAVLPTLLLWIPKQILDGLVAFQRGHGDLKKVWLLLALEFSLALTSDLLSQANNSLDTVLGERFTCHVTTLLIDHAGSVDLASFEDPLFYDKLERVRGQATGRVFMLVSLMNAAQESATLITLTISIVVFSPLLILIVVLASIPLFIGESHFSQLSYAAFFKRTPQRRLLEYLRLLATSEHSAKEVRIFGLAPYLSRRYRTLSQDIYKETDALALKRAVGGWVLGALSVAGYYSGYVIALMRTASGAFTLGTFVFLTGSLSRARMSTERMFSHLNEIAEHAVLLGDLITLLKIQPSIRSMPGSHSFPDPVMHGIEFRNVSFFYPGSSRLVVDRLNLKIGPSERIALIGSNGAGKTTIVKLLARLYDPAEGQIFLDGIDLRDYDVESLRSHISVTLQDFVEYELRVRENIGVGDIESVNNDERQREAAAKGGIARAIDLLPLRYEQVLGRRFKEGIDLSGGEWQKIALSRMFYRDATLFILDEPTASLDPESEYEFLRRFNTLMRGRMAVLISHKLSTARMADRIIVLERGKVSEEGTHDDLINRGGRYATLFAIQAQAFEDIAVASEQ
jgi:ATP-binding cassette subfamily B protein